MLLRKLFALGLLASVAMPAWAQERVYANDRFGYSVPVPRGFVLIREAENSDGATFEAARGDAELLVWGSNLLVDSFLTDVDARIKADRIEGWDVSYRRDTPRWASWSGLKEGRIFYSRAIPLCDGAVGFFRLEYDADAKKAYDATIKNLINGFESASCG